MAEEWRKMQAHGTIRLVTDEDLEQQLALVRASAAGPLAGVFGPQSLTWRLDREAISFLAAGRALVLQLAHPWVGAAIAQHSRSLHDPIGRFHRTFGIVFAMIFGTIDQAFTAARQLHRRHASITGVLPAAIGSFAQGSPYWANEIGALSWVHATLTESAVLVHDLILPPLADDERELYYAESKLFAGLFGIPQSSLPRDWKAFRAYNEAMHDSGLLVLSPQTKAIADKLLAGTGTWLPVPRWYRAVTSGLLPPGLRASFRPGRDEQDRRSAEQAIHRIRRFYPMLPRRLRYVGPFHEGQARLRGQQEPGYATRLLNRLWIGKPRLGAGTQTMPPSD